MTLTVWLRRGLAVIICVLAAVLALAAAGLLPYYLAASTSRVATLGLSSVVAFAAVASLGAWLAALLWRAQKRSKFAAAFSGILTAAFAIALYLTILRPSQLHMTDIAAPGNTRYWQLSTGSQIAYTEYDPPAGVPVKPDPILFLHGGPGMRVGPYDHEFYSPLAAYGFRVYLFDQAGSGLSDFLPRVRDYTITRAVADLEAIRQQIRAEKMILIGHSWGSSLAANYIAKYPDHVAKVIFYSPGPIWSWSQEASAADFSRTSGGSPNFFQFRLLAAMLLQDRNPEAAQNLLPQLEAEELFVPFVAPTGPTLVCKGDADKLPLLIDRMATGNVNPRMNPYVLQLLANAMDDPAGDPHTALKGNSTPAIILFGECDYLPWSTKLDYRKTFPKAKVYYVPRAGHFIQFEQPELMKRIVTTFLLDQPEAVPFYSGDADPRMVKTTPQ